MMKKVASTVSLLVICLCVSAQGRFDGVEIKSNKLTDQIYMLEGSGGNIGVLVGDEGVFMIDDQYAPLSEKIKAAIAKISDKKVTFLVNTHWHGDHAGGNENFSRDGALILAHDNVRKRMGTPQTRGGNTTPPSPEIALPKITYSDNMELFINGQEAKMIHVGNAHTDGDSFIWFPESNVLHMGDCFFNQRFPYIDLDSGGSVDGAIKAVEVALMLVDDDTQIIPGHGPMATKADLSKYQEFLKTVRERVYSFVSVGRSMENIKPEEVVKGYEDWSWGFIDANRLTTIFFNSLSSQ